MPYDFNGNGHPALHLPDHTAILIDQSRALGRIEAAQLETSRRLDKGDARFDKQDAILLDIHGRVKAVEQRPYRKRDLKGTIEGLSSLIKESWPFAALLAGAVAKATGTDLSVVSKLLGH